MLGKVRFGCHLAAMPQSFARSITLCYGAVVYVVLFVLDRKVVVHALHASGTKPNITCFSVILFIITCAAINKWIWSITFCLARFHKYGRQDLPHWSPRSSLQSPKSSLRSPRSCLQSPRSCLRSPRSSLWNLKLSETKVWPTHTWSNSNLS